MTTETQNITIQEFIKHVGITMVCEWVDRNPNMPNSERDMDNWKCKLLAHGRRMTIYFSKGFGHDGASPETAEVLDCLSSDAAGFSNSNNFEDWCNEYGYDSDSRTAERIYKAVRKQAAQLEQFLGHDLYNQLLWEVERM